MTLPREQHLSIPFYLAGNSCIYLDIYVAMQAIHHRKINRLAGIFSRQQLIVGTQAASVTLHLLHMCLSLFQVYFLSQCITTQLSSAIRNRCSHITIQTDYCPEGILCIGFPVQQTVCLRLDTSSFRFPKSTI